jgi:hypothetical protein
MVLHVYTALGATSIRDRFMGGRVGRRKIAMREPELLGGKQKLSEKGGNKRRRKNALRGGTKKLRAPRSKVRYKEETTDVLD